ncbi:MAG: tetratricopeptide repeat protein [Deltaproteobacteria bacterium]|jgi:tol-pal system protein YbgF|nr:tetratricopeptide repeat protein [Deltaproteobacteria bacterium]
MQKTKKLLSAALTMALLCSCAAKKREVDDLNTRSRFQDQQLQQMQPALADTGAQLQAMQQELAMLRGQLDDLQSAGGARALVEKVNRHEAALRQVESTLVMNFNLNAPGAANTPPPASNPAGAEQFAPAGLVAGAGVAGAAGAAGGGAPPTAPAPAAAQKDTATALHDHGLASYNARNYQEALRAFTDFTKSYANHKLAPSAWFYLGDSNFQLNRFGDAAQVFNTVITKYGASPKTPEAYWKQAFSFCKLGHKEGADARWKELIAKFPNSPFAAQAKQSLQQKDRCKAS